MATPSGVDPAAWAALLRWSMKQNSIGTEGPEAEPTATPKPMSKEDRDWLEAVMKDGVVDLVKRASEIIEQLKTDCLEPVRQNHTMDDYKVDGILEIMDELQDICEQIDFAMSLCQIGGVPPLLEICHPGTNLSDDIRAAALGVLATVTQNNPYTQNALFNLNALPLMVGIAIKESNTVPLRLKAIHAVSCMVRGFQPLEDVFFTGQYPVVTNFTEEGMFVEGSISPVINVRGPEVLSIFISDKDIRIRRKGAFLVGALLTQDGVSKDKVDAYYEACAGSLVAILTPLTSVIPEGETDHGLDIDIREITLKTLTYFADRGKKNELLSSFGQVMNQSRDAAQARVASGVDVENAQAEVDLWKQLM